MLKNPSVFLVLAVIFTLSFLNSTLTAATFQDDYDNAYEQFSKLGRTDPDQLKQIAGTFRKLSERSDAGKLKANAIYWEGQSLFMIGEYLQALQAFERVLVNQNSFKEQDARFKVVQCQIRLKWRKSGKWELDRFVRDFPQSKLINVLKNELRRIEK
ncbi:MAG: tetratricopeptide repeat protein [Calditrichaeota bacterium]|nr:tetratricopeptide repeat protein [Calditrichota bacterium]